MYYQVTFQWYKTDTYCSNICIADTMDEVERYYREKYSGYLNVQPASDYDVAGAKKKGMPFINLKERR